MLATRSVEVIPALLVPMLHDAGKLPVPPPEPDRNARGFRFPGLTEIKAYQWVAEWEGPRVDESGFRKAAGVAGYRDGFDWHTASDVRELVCLFGSPRALVNLALWLRADARAVGRRLIGSFDRDNIGLETVLTELGFRRTRIVMEDLS